LGKSCKPVIAVHGGAGTWEPAHSQPALKSVKTAAQLGFEVLKVGGTAVDAVVEAVASMEDSGNFNAGAGSALNIEKRVEMEASVMDGGTLRAGAAALLSDVRNPVRLARVVMDETAHVLVVGRGAEQLARAFKLERRSPVDSVRAVKHYEAQMNALRQGKGELPKLAELIKAHPEVFQLETVGAVALDTDGNVAAATSTGGFPLKLAGRIGDSPLIGCGVYADNQSGACSATGGGEVAIRLVVAKAVCDRIEDGRTPQDAAEETVALVKSRVSGVYNDMGFIALDVQGSIGAAHSSPNLCWAFMSEKHKAPVASLNAKLVNGTLR
jgi:beta-aspartyl-peptidase (threonine type)